MRRSVSATGRGSSTKARNCVAGRSPLAQSRSMTFQSTILKEPGRDIVRRR